ncbi:GNAT family N-acetyltransferase [Tardiphaga sp.]|uniref:GNAT family N-acetyltransferase n=1 Tax=Tardiphaga sp. TaxID=1926292 RepID=UPI0026382708|nr:GNAT family N-acetyltransferase [Tardiphaga sp.]MDB5620802.1 family acetyltransferase [Tardiphaga sp.]
MYFIDPRHLDDYSDALLTRSGAVVTVRFAGAADAEALQGYFRDLSQASRYRRLMGAARELPVGQLDVFTHLRDDGRFTVLATMTIDGHERIVGEARYAFDEATSHFEFGLSVANQWQGHGLGMALLSNLQCRAAALGAETLFGDTLPFNDAMLGLARRAGFTFAPTPGDWKQIRLEKRIAIAPQEISCASWRLRAEAMMQISA